MKSTYVKNCPKTGYEAELSINTMVLSTTQSKVAFISSSAGASSFLFAMNKEQTTQLAVALMVAAGELDDDIPSV